MRHLTLLQLEPTAAVAPSADLVAWSRLGDRYRPEHLTRALEEDRTLLEHNAMVRPMEDLRLYLAAMAVWPGREASREWLRANDSFRRDVLDLLGRSGPVPAREIPDTCVVPWTSTGWTNDRNVTQARCIRNERRLRALGVARAKGASVPAEPVDVGEAGEPATIEGVPGSWRVDPEALGQPFTGRTALLSPFDRLVHDRMPGPTVRRAGWSFAASTRTCRSPDRCETTSAPGSRRSLPGWTSRSPTSDEADGVGRGAVRTTVIPCPVRTS